jgi:membrane fusion protein (multidrug efflux system)
MTGNNEQRWECRTAALLLAIAIGGGAACSTDESSARTWREGDKLEGEAEEEAVPVEVAALQRGPIEAILRFSSNLEAERSVQVFAEAPRQVIELLVEEGRSVRKGHVLVRLEDEEQRSTLAKAESELKQSRRDFKRTEDLFNQNLVTEKLYNDAAYTVERNELAADDARRELSYTEVRAPIGGVVTRRLVNLGDYVTLNQPLFQIVDFDSIVARIYVPEKELIRLKPNQAARLSADALGGAVFKGTIERIAPVVDPETGTLKVTVATPPQPGLRPGMYVDVELVTATHDEALLVPKRALVYDNDQVFVFRLGEERRVERLTVRPILENSEYVEPAPTDSLQANDPIIVAGQSGLKDGGLVRLPGDPKPEKDSSEASGAE